MWKVYDNNNDGQWTNCYQKSSLEPSFSSGELKKKALVHVSQLNYWHISDIKKIIQMYVSCLITSWRTLWRQSEYHLNIDANVLTEKKNCHPFINFKSIAFSFACQLWNKQAISVTRRFCNTKISTYNYVNYLQTETGTNKMHKVPNK